MEGKWDRYTWREAYLFDLEGWCFEEPVDSTLCGQSKSLYLSDESICSHLPFQTPLLYFIGSLHFAIFGNKSNVTKTKNVSPVDLNRRNPQYHTEHSDQRTPLQPFVETDFRPRSKATQFRWRQSIGGMRGVSERCSVVSDHPTCCVINLLDVTEDTALFSKPRHVFNVGDNLIRHNLCLDAICR